MKFDLNSLGNIEFSADRSSKILDALRRMYPDASEKDLFEGKENLENYLKLALKIAVRLNTEKEGGDF